MPKLIEYVTIYLTEKIYHASTLMNLSRRCLLWITRTSSRNSMWLSITDMQLLNM